MNKIPSWAYYVAGVAIFVLVFLYLNNSTVPKTTTTVVRTVDLNNLNQYNGDANILTGLLQSQQDNLSTLHTLGLHTPTGATVGNASNATV